MKFGNYYMTDCLFHFHSNYPLSSISNYRIPPFSNCHEILKIDHFSREVRELGSSGSSSTSSSSASLPYFWTYTEERPDTRNPYLETILGMPERSVHSLLQINCLDQVNLIIELIWKMQGNNRIDSKPLRFSGNGRMPNWQCSLLLS